MTPERRDMLRKILKHFDESHAIDPRVMELAKEALAALDMEGRYLDILRRAAASKKPQKRKTS